MIDPDMLRDEYAADPYRFLETNGTDAQRAINAATEKRETLARMVRAVADTEAGRYVLNWLVETYVMKGHFIPDINAGMEAVAMRGLYTTAQAEVVLTLIGLSASQPKKDHPHV